MENLKEAILAYVRSEYADGNDGEIDCSTPLISGGIVDSFSMVSLRLFLEKTYAIHIPDSDATPDNFDTVNAIAELVDRVKPGSQPVRGALR